MSTAEGLWHVEELGEEGLTVELTTACTARELALALLGSKAAVGRLLARGQLSRDGIRLAHDAHLMPGDHVHLAFWCEDSIALRSDGSVEVCYQDPVLLAADKPAGLLVHGDGTGAETLTARVQGLLARQGSAARAQAVQRLDVETTGLVLFSLTEEFQPSLDAQVAGHAMGKRYVALVEGAPTWSADAWTELTGPIGRDRHDARRMHVGAGGKAACTRVRPVGARGGRTLLLVELGSGRRHQIRVHLAHAGHPIVGDELYGRRAACGLMLHALEERLMHPLTGQELVVRTAWPERFSQAGFDKSCMRNL